MPGAWQAIEFDDAQWQAVAVMQGAWVRDWTEQRRRNDLTEPLPAPPCVCAPHVEIDSRTCSWT